MTTTADRDLFEANPRWDDFLPKERESSAVKAFCFTGGTSPVSRCPARAFGTLNNLRTTFLSGAWPQAGSEALVAAAAVVAVGRAFVAIAASAVDASARSVASLHRSRSVLPTADVPYPVAAGASAVPVPASVGAFAVVADISCPSRRSPCWAQPGVP